MLHSGIVAVRGGRLGWQGIVGLMRRILHSGMIAVRGGRLRWQSIVGLMRRMLYSSMVADMMREQLALRVCKWPLVVRWVRMFSRWHVVWLLHDASAVVRMTGAASGRRGGVLVTSDESAITLTVANASWARADVVDEVRLFVL
jgi:hypothetical protein